MIAGMLISLIQVVFRVYTLIVIVDVALSFFMSPYHTVRLTLDKLVEPLLQPIRRFVPALGSIDFSPLVLILLLQVVEVLLVSLISSLL
jgi:YggT family protein